MNPAGLLVVGVALLLLYLGVTGRYKTFIEVLHGGPVTLPGPVKAGPS